MKTLIVTAMKAESPAVGRPHVLLGTCGVGPRNAADAMERMVLRERPDRILLTGFCGGVDPMLRPGDFSLPRDVAYGSDTETVTEEVRLDLARIVEGLGLRSSPGTMETFDATVLSLAGVRSGAASVDMEAFFVVRCANRHGIPVAVIKAVSDLIPRKRAVLCARFLVLLRMIGNYPKAKSRIDTVFSRWP